MSARAHIFDLDRESFRSEVASWGWPAYRADQALQWLYRQHVADPDEMTNLSRADRACLRNQLRMLDGTIVGTQHAADGVRKLLVQWPPGDRDAALPLADDSSRQTECVMIPAGKRRTACVSSQIGCPVGCTFCASGLGGLDGNLTAGQIVEQVWRLREGAGAEGPGPGKAKSSDLNARGESFSNSAPTHVVFMGMGEPLANFDNVVRAVRTLTAEWGMNISGRRVTISTVGLPAQIRRLADLRLSGITLALSLHATDDDLRRELIPWAHYTTIDELLDACRYFFSTTGREITLEYTLIRNVNDRGEQARQLARIARTLRSNVNLIRYNEVPSLPYERPTTDDVRAFATVLRDAGVNTHVRASRGRDIAAACGQLRRQVALNHT